MDKEALEQLADYEAALLMPLQASDATGIFSDYEMLKLWMAMHQHVARDRESIHQWDL